MYRSGLAYIFVLSILAVGCSTSTEPTPIGDAATPDRPSDAHQDSLDDPTCFWKTLARSTLPHFRFLLTTPDGQPQSPPTSLASVDAGSWAIHDFEGKVTSKVGDQLSVDSCVSPASCQPSVYQFTFCDPSATSCRASSSSSSPSPMEAAIPLGQLVRVVWYLDNDVPEYSPGLYFLAIYDAEPGPHDGSILFVGSGGRSDDKVYPAPNPLQSLPFSVATKALGCDAARPYGADDYAFVFQTKDGVASSLQLATGESGTLSLTPPSGGSQLLNFRVLDAVQTALTDDYWNWDFWASADVPSPGDAGQGE